MNARRHVAAQHGPAVLLVGIRAAGVGAPDFLKQLVGIGIRRREGKRRHTNPIGPGRQAIAGAGNNEDHLAAFGRLDQGFSRHRTLGRNGYNATEVKQFQVRRDDRGHLGHDAVPLFGQGQVQPGGNGACTKQKDLHTILPYGTGVASKAASRSALNKASKSQ